MEAHTRVPQMDEPLRRDLIEGLWPDKSLYGAVLLFLAGLVGLATWLVDQTIGVRYGEEAVTLFGWIPSWATALFSALASVAAMVALRKRSTRWTQAGALFAILSVGFAAANVVLGLIALDFVRRARREGEDENPATRIMTPDMWPDKLLAASLLFVVASVVTLAWGLAIAFDFVTFAGYVGPRVVFGAATAAVGVVGLVAARRLYVQESPLFGLVAAVLLGAAVALWVVGPVLACAALVLIVLGWTEEEFGAARPKAAA